MEVGDILNENQNYVGVERGAQCPLVTSKDATTVGNWNVCTMYATGAAAQVAKEMTQYKIAVLGISKCRWTGEEELDLK